MPPKPLRLAIDLPDTAKDPGGWAPDGSDPKRYPGLYHGHIICLEDGKRLTVLTRYLTCQYGLTPRQYRKRWGLPADYPMSCESQDLSRHSALCSWMPAWDCGGSSHDIWCYSSSRVEISRQPMKRYVLALRMGVRG